MWPVRVWKTRLSPSRQAPTSAANLGPRWSMIGCDMARTIGSGARGVACAKVGEAEVLARAGIRGLLITTEIVAPAAIRRLMHLVSEAPDTLIVVDHPDNVAALGREAAADGVVVDVLVDVD